MKKSILAAVLCALFLLTVGCGKMPPTSASVLAPSDSPEIGEIVLRKGKNAIEWKYEDEGDYSWRSLVLFSELLGTGEDGENIELRSESDSVQWRLEDGEWAKLVSLADIKGPAGNYGANGKTPEFRVYENNMQWKYTGDTTWLNMTDMSAHDGKDGKAGKDGTVWHSGSGVLRTELLNPVAYVEGVKRGDYYLDTESGKIYVCEFAGMVSGGNNSRWKYVSNIKGEKGAKGEKGDTGAKGEKGDTGYDGSPGDYGSGLEWFSFSESLNPDITELDKDNCYKHSPNLKNAKCTTDLIKANGASVKLAEGHKYMVALSYVTGYLSLDDNKKYDDTGTYLSMYSKNTTESYSATNCVEDHILEGNGSYTVIVDPGEYEFSICTFACKTMQYDIVIIVLS